MLFIFECLLRLSCCSFYCSETGSFNTCLLYKLCELYRKSGLDRVFVTAFTLVCSPNVEIKLTRYSPTDTAVTDHIYPVI